MENKETPIDIYNKANEFKRLDAVINKAKIDAESKENLLEFKRHLFISGSSKRRIAKFVYLGLRLRQMLEKPLSKATKKDIERVVEKLESSDLKDWTRRDYKVVLKKFYKWLLVGTAKGADGYPAIVAGISLAMRNNRHTLPEEILTSDEVMKLVDAAINNRDKAFIYGLYESGARIAEFLGMRRKHIEFDDYGAILHMDGKTGGRRVRVIASSPAIAVWYDNHPQKNNPGAPLWINQSSNRLGQPLNYAGASKLLRTLARRVGITKRVNPHALRHARATHLANSLTEAQMKELFGWTQGSSMAAIYVHLSGRDVDNKLIELAGLKKPEDNAPAHTLIKKCPRCNEQNPGDSTYCRRCAYVLDLETAKKMAKAEDILNRLLADPRSRKLLVARLYETLPKKS